jgi:hypothetical protein
MASFKPSERQGRAMLEPVRPTIMPVIKLLAKRLLRRSFNHAE